MPSNFFKWLKQIQLFFFGESDQKVEAKKYHGRLESDERQVTARVIHQYPKEGKFRFPVKLDGVEEKQNEQKWKERSSLSNDVMDETSEKKSDSGKRQSFSNEPFKPTNIPSPIYGFKERNHEKIHYSYIDKEDELEQVDEQRQIEEEPLSEEMELEADLYVEQQNEVAVTVAQEIEQENYEVEPVNSPVIPTEKSERNDKKKVTKGEKTNVPKKTKTTRRSNRNYRNVPYNVMMFPQDREAQSRIEKQTNPYLFPKMEFLKIAEKKQADDEQWLEEQAQLLEETLTNFNVKAKVVEVTKGPSVTRFEIQPAPGVKVSKVTSLIDDIKLSLAARDIRIEAPIPGKHAIGIEIPNKVSSPVFLREIIRQPLFAKSESPLTVVLGLDISGQAIVTDLKKMPHGLIAGATGSGKSVCINSILVSLLYKAKPDEVKLMLIDPKMVELAPYNGLPHLISPVITDAKQATAALKWVVMEMERRYELFSEQGVRDISRYNELCSEEKATPALPYIVVIIDELADLMMVSPQDVEDAICRIAQKARACGIHLLLATQRPSVDVITGLIKANVPTRIAFSVSSQIDSRTIIDMNGAERLLGKGDMLFHENGAPKPIRVQGTFVSDDEIDRVVAFVKQQKEPVYLLEKEQLMRTEESIDQEDDLFEEACYFVMEQNGASASMLQRRFRIGYNRAARLIDMMEAKGIISEAMGSKPRNILMSVSDFETLILDQRSELGQ